jgi:hypothetical protein
MSKFNKYLREAIDNVFTNRSGPSKIRLNRGDSFVGDDRTDSPKGHELPCDPSDALDFAKCMAENGWNWDDDQEYWYKKGEPGVWRKGLNGTWRYAYPWFQWSQGI